ncbi:MAG: DUF2779 domain-containing protein [Proteobacteria bacterium]|nr:DUF2779 domain-containing protein [Pseudomonadota bacterium]
MVTSPNISKSQYLKGLQCPLALWYYRYRKDLKPEIDDQTQARFDAGNEIGKLAQQYFDGGVQVTDDYWKIGSAIQSTKAFIDEGYELIFEATAMHPIHSGYARIDIFQKVPNTEEWNMIEVKSSTSVKDYHIDDVAFQYHVFHHAGYKIRNCYLMVVNNEYVRQGDIDPKSLLKLEDITEEVMDKQDDVEQRTKQLVDVLDQNDEPKVDIGSRCFTPFECDYRQHCWKHVPEYSVYNIYSKKKADEVSKTIDSYDVNDIPPGLLPGGVKTIDIDCYKNDKTYLEKDSIKEFLDQLEYPLHYLDYETIQSGLPLYDGTRPYQQIPFQFSLHIQDSPDTEPRHFEFLHKEMSDPRQPFAERLLSVCGNEGSVVVYNQTFEAARNREIASAFPQFADYLEAINARIVDLMEPFQKRWLYSPEQMGSYSLKYVLPTYTKYSYEGMEIASGGDASLKYLNFAKGLLTEEECNNVWKSLSEYCKHDTYAMVKLIEYLMTII